MSDEKKPGEKNNEQETSQEPVEHQERWLPGLYFSEYVPAWGVSMILHAIGIVVLALLTLAIPREQEVPEMVMSASEVVEDMEEIPKDLEVVVEKPEIEEFVPDVTDVIEDPGEAILGDLAETEVAVPSGLGDVAMIDVGALVWDMDLTGQGKGEQGDGLGVASFFGVATRGRKFMYVVDNSNSMQGGKFEMACSELYKSISGLSSNHDFYIIFYSDTAYPLFYPDSAPRWVKATPENKRKVGYWLDEVHRCLKTNGALAMSEAFKMRPDVIYLLGDGSFTDKTVPMTLAFDNPRVVVHTLGFGMKAGARQGFEQIAAKFKGKFHEVKVTQAAARASQVKKRPKNKQQNGKWGIKLGAGKNKKKK